MQPQQVPKKAVIKPRLILSDADDLLKRRCQAVTGSAEISPPISAEPGWDDSGSLIRYETTPPIASSESHQPLPAEEVTVLNFNVAYVDPEDGSAVVGPIPTDRVLQAVIPRDEFVGSVEERILSGSHTAVTADPRRRRSMALEQATSVLSQLIYRDGALVSVNDKPILACSESPVEDLCTAVAAGMQWPDANVTSYVKAANLWIGDFVYNAALSTYTTVAPMISGGGSGGAIGDASTALIVGNTGEPVCQRLDSNAIAERLVMLIHPSSLNYIGTWIEELTDGQVKLGSTYPGYRSPAALVASIHATATTVHLRCSQSYYLQCNIEEDDVNGSEGRPPKSRGPLKLTVSFDTYLVKEMTSTTNDDSSIVVQWRMVYV